MPFPFFRRKGAAEKAAPRYDPEKLTPAIRCSICTGEQVAGFRHREDGRFEEVALIRSEADLQAFREKYGITGAVEKFY